MVIHSLLRHELTLINFRSDDYWQKPLEHKAKDVKLMVKRVFITSNLGDAALPQWASWVKVVVDGKLLSY